MWGSGGRPTASGVLGSLGFPLEPWPLFSQAALPFVAGGTGEAEFADWATAGWAEEDSEVDPKTTEASVVSVNLLWMAVLGGLGHRNDVRMPLVASQQ